ncbi:MAG: ABC transporter ATP-binding protein [Lachnospiraceae bacterium]|nr:ABC transporter ATP-binding protein [Lachnospiraceae bacterium]
MKEKDLDTLRYISRISGKNMIHIGTLLLVQITLGASSVFYALLLREVIDHAIDKDKTAMGRAIFFLVLLVAFQIALRAVVRFLREYSASVYENAFKQRLFSVLLSKDFSSVNAVHSGEWLNRLTSDTQVIAEGMSSILPGIAEMFTKMLGAAVMIIVMEPRFGMILVPGGLIMAALTYVFRKQLKRLHKKVQESDGHLRMFMQEHLESLVIIKTYGKEEKSVVQAKEKMSDHKRARMNKNHFSNVCNIGFATAMNGAYVLGVIYGAFGIYSGTVTYGTLTALLQLISQIQSPFANITGYLPKYYAMIASAERIMESERFIEDIVSDKKVAVTDFTEFGFEDASFSYKEEGKEDTVVFEHLDFSVRKKEFVAFTGASGCGKSTILKLLMSLYPLISGERYIVGEEGKKELNASYRSLFAYVPQGNLLMSGSVKDIVTYAAENDNDINKALEIACASEFILELQNGVDTKLGEKGNGLSEGQMQRLAIARAICSDRPVLLLDEATSALDEQTEKRLLMNLKAMTDKTVIIVTHRPAALAICDREVHFDEIRGGVNE